VGGVRVDQHLRGTDAGGAEFASAARGRRVRLFAASLRRRDRLRVRLVVRAGHHAGYGRRAGHGLRGVLAEPGRHPGRRLQDSGDRHRRDRDSDDRQYPWCQDWRGARYRADSHQGRRARRDHWWRVSARTRQLFASDRRPDPRRRTGASRGVGHLDVRRMDCRQHDCRRS